MSSESSLREILQLCKECLELYQKLDYKRFVDLMREVISFASNTVQSVSPESDCDALNSKAALTEVFHETVVQHLAKDVEEQKGKKSITASNLVFAALAIAYAISKSTRNNEAPIDSDTKTRIEMEVVPVLLESKDWRLRRIALRMLSSTVGIQMPDKTATSIMEVEKEVDSYICKQGEREATDQNNENVFLEDLREAFTDHFEEIVFQSGLGAVDMFHYQLRNSLYSSWRKKISLQSKRARKGQPVRFEPNDAPLYPYMTLVQSSGSGKSRLLREVGKTLPLAYGNLNDSSTKGYPIPNKDLRSYLLYGAEQWAENVIDIIECKQRCRKLLWGVVIVFQLLFGKERPAENRVYCPKKENMNRVSRGIWGAPGIREVAEGSKELDSSLFWDLAIAVARLDTDNDDDMKKWKKDYRDAAKRKEKEAELGKELKGCGRILVEASGCKEQLECNAEQQGNVFGRGDSYSGEEFLVSAMSRIKQYLALQACTELREVACKLQPSEHKAFENGLGVVFIAIDESRCLVKAPVSTQKRNNGDGGEGASNVFRCLRSVSQDLDDELRVNVFLIFSDTTAKLANFAPRITRDPSARIMPARSKFEPRQFEVPGLPAAPFTDLLTEKVGVSLPKYKEYNFYERLKDFCHRWGTPEGLDGLESVTEELTSIPLPKRILSTADSGMNREDECEKGNDLSESDLQKTQRGEVLFTNDLEYVYLGRPLWASITTRNQKEAGWKEVVLFAHDKLLGGGEALAKKQSETYAQQCLAALACRAPLQFNSASGMAPQLVSEHMAWCDLISWDRDSVHLRYINEPVLASGAALIWRYHLAELLELLNARLASILTNQGDVGEATVCIFFLDAVDKAYYERTHAGKREEKMEIVAQSAADGDRSGALTPAQELYQRRIQEIPEGFSMYETVTLCQFLESGFNVNVVTAFENGTLQGLDLSCSRPGKCGKKCKGYRWSFSSGARECHVYVPETIATGQVRFKSIKATKGVVGCRDLPFLFEANLALMAKAGQKGIDIIIPLRCRVREGGQSSFCFSCVTVQVKNRKRSPRAFEIGGEHICPTRTGAVQCNDLKEDGDIEEENCKRCKFMCENHFGIALNTQEGTTFKLESGMAWTFLSCNVLSEKGMSRRSTEHGGSHGTKKRRLNAGGKSMESGQRFGSSSHVEQTLLSRESAELGPADDMCDAPKSANMIVNGLTCVDAKSKVAKTDLEVLWQLRELCMRDTHSGIMDKWVQGSTNAAEFDAKEMRSTSAIYGDSDGIEKLVEAIEFFNEVKLGLYAQRR